MNKMSNSSVETKKLKYVCSINDEMLNDDTYHDFEIQYIDIGNVDSNGTIDTIVNYKFGEAPSRARRIVRRGDTIVSTVRTYLQAITSIDFEADNLIVSTGFAVVRPKVNVYYSNFCKYVLRDPVFLAEVERRSVGVSYPAINASEIGDILVPVPPIESQIKTANYLEKELGFIEALIQTKQSQLKILSEKRQAVIIQAVTRGLSTNVELRDSGISWLGEIPNHWKVKKIKYIATLRSGDFITSESIRKEDLFPVYGGNGLRGYTSDKTHHGNFVLIGRQGALCGNINYAFGDFWASEHAIVCNPLVDYNVTWLGELLRIMNLNQYSVAAAQPGLSVDVIKNLAVPVPLVSEQNEISNFIHNETELIDMIELVTVSSIELLKERRSSLITAAVTGQLEIRS